MINKSDKIPYFLILFLMIEPILPAFSIFKITDGLAESVCFIVLICNYFLILKLIKAKKYSVNFILSSNFKNALMISSLIVIYMCIFIIPKIIDSYINNNKTFDYKRIVATILTGITCFVLITIFRFMPVLLDYFKYKFVKSAEENADLIEK